MTFTAYYVLLALELVALAVLVVPPVVAVIRMDNEATTERQAAKRRIAARELAAAKLPAAPDNPPDPKELT
ncbi:MULTISPECIES: hypothetical protein [unclassified Streptomyces]|uniref:hypothetical protein n=1 Tax=unclassified Streptomyces TaxID=2593676 RepID=UPI00081DC037|nr:MULTISPECIES: hypothetical protein [unclassified Streptomyces]MYZ33933.1 hypothetical protein [Streptomyces sp. SID4917]SCF62810.1 hypothetical protein GA0115259_1003413 [Streptomyces sp. MnatMP-M17]